MTLKQKGLTLIELLLVISIITVLTAVILIALDPAQRIAEARNATRNQEVTSILNAILEYELDNTGSAPSGIDTTANSVQLIGVDSGSVSCGGVTCGSQTVVGSSCFVDLTSDLVDAYLSAIPTDPQNGDADDTRYYVNVTSGGRVVVGACDAELSETIEVQR